jgi:cytochrome c
MIRAILTTVVMLAGMGSTYAQIPFGAPRAVAPPDRVSLFLNQRGICRTTDPKAPPRRGPNLAGVYMHHVGSAPGFKYSAGFVDQDFVWDDAHLTQWITNPQAMILGAVIVYRRADPATRQAIISFLEEQLPWQSRSIP